MKTHQRDIVSHGKAAGADAENELGPRAMR
jgi:hypothetical protein